MRQLINLSVAEKAEQEYNHYFKRLLSRIDKDNLPLLPLIEAFKTEIQEDSLLHMQLQTAIAEATKSGRRVPEDVAEFFVCLNQII